MTTLTSITENKEPQPAGKQPDELSQWRRELETLDATGRLEWAYHRFGRHALAPLGTARVDHG